MPLLYGKRIAKNCRQCKIGFTSCRSTHEFCSHKCAMEYQRSRLSYTEDHHTILRKKVVNHLGGKCIRCGFTDWRALQIDHVEGNGSDETKWLGRSKYHRQVLADKTGKYQLLCANCNWIKRYENRETPSPRIENPNKIVPNIMKALQGLERHGQDKYLGNERQ